MMQNSKLLIAKYLIIQAKSILASIPNPSERLKDSSKGIPEQLKLLMVKIQPLIKNYNNLDMHAQEELTRIPSSLEDILKRLETINNRDLPILEKTVKEAK